MTKTKTNAEQIENAGAFVTAQPANLPAFLSDVNPTTEQSQKALVDALDYLIVATTCNVNIPDVAGDTDIEVVSDEQNGEVETIKCRVANRYGRMQRGLLDAVLRQLDFSIAAATKEIDDIKRDVGNAMRSMQRSQDPTKLRDFVDSKLSWADVIADQVGHAQALRDAAADAYFDLMGRPYVPYEKRERRTIDIPAPAAGQASDPLLNKAAAFLKG